MQSVPITTIVVSSIPVNGEVYFTAKHTTLRRKNKNWLAQNQDNVPEWGDKFIHGLLFQ